MKNLATCTPTEFVRQTAKIKGAVEKWLTATDVMNIRKRLPDLLPITEGMNDEERRGALLSNAEARREQNRKNLSDIFDAVFAEHPDETLELLALLCFVEPDKIDEHPISEYMGAMYEALSDENVLRFFSLFRRLAASGT